VKAGQVLGRQDDAEERNALNELQISSSRRTEILTALRKTGSKNDATQKGYEQRWTQVQDTRAGCGPAIEDRAARAARTAHGMVLRRDGEVGEDRGPTDVLFWVGPPLPMQVVAEVNEEEINRIAVGQKALLRSEAFPAQALAPASPRSRRRATDPQDLPRLSLAANDTPLRIACRSRPTSSSARRRRDPSVPAEAVSGDSCQTVDNGRLERGAGPGRIRGSRNVEVIGDISRGWRCCRRPALILPTGQGSVLTRASR